MNGSDKITVAHVAGGLEHGGVEMVIYRYVSHMDPSRYNWIYISYNTPDEGVRRRFEAQGFRVYQVPRKRENLIRGCRQIYKILRENHVQIIHTHLSQMSFVANITAMAAGVRTRIAHMHMVIHPRGMRVPISWLCRKLSTWSATARFACSEDAARSLFGKRGAKRAIIMRNALDPDEFAFDAGARARLRGEYGLEGRPVIGHVGRFVELKNHSFLLRAFAGFHRGNPNSRLVLIGEGPTLAQTRALADELCVSDSVLFVPPTDEVSRWYMAMDVFVLPSRSEGFGLVAIEAQLAGLPAVLSTTVPREVALSDRVRFLNLEAGCEAWSEAIGAALAPGRGGDVREELARRQLDIAQEAQKLDHFYREGVWE